VGAEEQAVEMLSRAGDLLFDGVLDGSGEAWCGCVEGMTRGVCGVELGLVSAISLTAPAGAALR